MSSLSKEFYTTVLLGVILAIAVLIVLYNFINKTVIEEKLESARLQAKTIVAYRHYLSLVAPKVKILDNNLSPFCHYSRICNKSGC